MGSHELLVTELVFKNALTALQPAEIAALLSALVFQQKTNVEPELISSLKKVAACTLVKFWIILKLSSSRDNMINNDMRFFAGMPGNGRGSKKY